jgi:hypothetical protein
MGESEARVGRGVARWLVGVHLTGIAAALGLHLAVPPAVPELTKNHDTAQQDDSLRRWSGVCARRLAAKFG